MQPVRRPRAKPGEPDQGVCQTLLGRVSNVLQDQRERRRRSSTLQVSQEQSGQRIRQLYQVELFQVSDQSTRYSCQTLRAHYRSQRHRGRYCQASQREAMKQIKIKTLVYKFNIFKL